jgi:hypothetical protein
MTPMPVDRVLNALADRGSAPRRSGNSWMARCPAHDDSDPSLSVSVGADDRAVLCCHANCATEDVVGALGLKLADLFVANGSGHGEKATIVATYDYTDQTGGLLFQVVRMNPKSFRQRRPDGRGGWIWNLTGTRRVLYRLPAVRRAVDAGEVIFVAEGEKDVQALEQAGVVATCNPGGAGKWNDEYSVTLAGAKRVVVVADRDEPGRKHAASVAASLRGHVAEVVVVEAAVGKDAADHLAAGKTVEEFELTDSPIDMTALPDLDEFLADAELAYEWRVPDVLEAGDRLIVTGPEGGGKSTLLRQWAVQLASGVHPFTLGNIDPLAVLLIDAENSVRQTRRKMTALRTLAAERYQPGALRLHIVGHALDLTSADDEADLAARVERYRPHVLLGGPLYKLQAGDPKSEETARHVAGVLDRIRAICGTALILEAHSPYAEGSKAKRPIRPYGASLWSRWPEFGIHIAPDGKLEHWRGARDERDWPNRLERGAPWPWMPANEADSTADPWHGPTRCVDDIVAHLQTISPRECSARQLGSELRAAGASYRETTIRDAAEMAVSQDRATVRNGPRGARLYAVQPVHLHVVEAANESF